jgi:hypothetical protein
LLDSPAKYELAIKNNNNNNNNDNLTINIKDTIENSENDNEK